MDDPFRDLDLRGIEAAERKARAAYAVLWRVAELVMFVRDPARLGAVLAGAARPRLRREAEVGRTEAIRVRGLEMQPPS